jgi:plastocyanin
LAVGLTVSLYTMGCKKIGSSLEPSLTYTQIDNATAGTIEGTVSFAGKAPDRVEIDMAQDPACVMSSDGKNYTEGYVVNDGKLANAFVYVKDGLGKRIYPAPTSPVIIDQKGCRYVPHVVGVMAGQAVEFRTSDPTMHNINVQPSGGTNAAFDMSQAANGDAMRHTFSQPQTMIPVRCNNHPWMQAFINVSGNPFFAVSDSQGHFVIRGLPPGTYTLEVVHEKLGTKDQSVTVASHQTAKADFTFNRP